MKCVKTFYWSTADVRDEEDAKIQKKYNPSKDAAHKYANKIGGVVRTKSHPDDEGTEYRVYK